MKNGWTLTWRTLAAFGLVGLAGPAIADGSTSGVGAPGPVGSGAFDDQYRQAVLSLVVSTAKRDPRADVGGRWIPGPQAMRRVREGLSMTDAMSAAHAEGESPTFVPNDAVRARHLLSARGRW